MGQRSISYKGRSVQITEIPMGPTCLMGFPRERISPFHGNGKKNGNDHWEWEQWRFGIFILGATGVATLSSREGGAHN